ncbi:MAG: response regulator transcription factor [Acidimicrobiia bacterium]
MSRRVLVVDDEEPIRTLLTRLLTMEGYLVEEAGDARAALERIDARPPDLVLLDVMMPGQDGLDLLATLRRRSDVPIILLTARGDEADRVVGLRLGADDYVVKPFSPAELSARIATVLRRSSAPANRSRLSFGGLELDLASREVRVDGRLVEMPAREFDLLAFLAASPRQVFSREQLLDQVWSSSGEWQDPGTVTEHVRRVRRRIERDPDKPCWIVTVRGAGYRFEPDSAPGGNG